MTNKRTNDLEAKGTHVTHKPPYKEAYTEIYDWKEEYEVPFFMEWEGTLILRKILWKRGKLDSFESNVMKIKENLRREEY